MPTFAEWYEGNEMTASLESAFSAGAREWRKECERLEKELETVRRDNGKRNMQLHQRMTKAAIAYVSQRQKGDNNYDLLMAKVTELEDAADGWSRRNRS